MLVLWILRNFGGSLFNLLVVRVVRFGDSTANV